MAPTQRMPTSQAPREVDEPKGPRRGDPLRITPVSVAKPTDESGAAREQDESEDRDSGNKRPLSRGANTSRWVDYDTHELLTMISDLEDERRWARLREGFWLAILFHLILISAVTWIPRYVLKSPRIIDPFEAIKERKDLTYLDVPPDALRESKPKVAPKPLPKNQQLIDKKTMEDMKKEAPPAPPPPPQEQAPDQKPQLASPIPPQQQSQAQPEAPHPAAVPAKPNFAMGSQNPADQLREDLQNAAKNHNGPSTFGSPGAPGLQMHPGAGTGAPDVLSDTQGVDFSSWLSRWHYVTQRTWDPLIPDEVNPPILKSGVVAIRFKVLPNGQVTDMQLDGRSGDTALDRAAWGAISGSNYPALPREFHGPYLELRAYFMYNIEPK